MTKHKTFRMLVSFGFSILLIFAFTVMNVAPALAAQPPLAVDDACATNEDTVLSEYAPGVLGNDSDPDGDPLTAVLNNDVSYGSLTLSPDGSFSYTPNPNYHGFDTFTYYANDGIANSNSPATVTITIDPVNDPPIITGLPDVSLDENTDIDNAVDLWAYASDVEDPDSLCTFSIVGNSNPECGVSIDTNRYIDIDPDSNWNGYSDVTIQVQDTGSLIDTDTLRIIVDPVNDPPIVTVGYTTVSVDEGQMAYNGGSITLDGTYTVDLTPTLGEATWENSIYWIWDWWFETSDGPSESQLVTIEFTDGNGKTTTITFDLIVNNLAPEVDAGPDGTIYESGTFTGSGSFTDPGTDTWTATVNYGDGSGTQPLAISGKTFNLDHVYADDGIYSLTVAVTDDDGDTGTDTLEVTVIDVPPEEQIEDISDFFDDSVDSGELVGSGPGGSASGKLGAIRNMLDEAERLIDEGFIFEACQQLHSIYIHIDGIIPPPDFVIGPAAAELADKINMLRSDLGCE